MSEHAAMFRQCLIDLDAPMMRQLWWHVAPHLPQPVSDMDCLKTMHVARTEMLTLPEELRAYSESWLKEHGDHRIAYAVGIAAMTRRPYTVYTQEVMADAVTKALQSGVDLATEATEVKRLMMAARKKELTPVYPVKKRK